MESQKIYGYMRVSTKEKGVDIVVIEQKVTFWCDNINKSNLILPSMIFQKKNDKVFVWAFVY